MSKKDLSKPQPRRPPAEREIDAFVRDGAGTGGNGDASARLTVDLPRATHRRFKAACALAGVKMNEEIRALVEKRCAELGEG